MLKGVHRVRRRLAGGGYSEHFYAWRGGPKIEAAPGTPEFLAEWQAATAGRDKPKHHAGTLQEIITAYQATPAFNSLAAATREGYIRQIRKIEAEFGDLPLKVLADDRVRGDFLDWRDRLAEKGKRGADYTFAVLALICAWAYDRRRIASNPCARPGRLYTSDRAEKVWSDAQIDAFTAQAPRHVALPFLIALWTGQREGDVLRLTWSAYDGQALRLRQSKTGRHVRIPVAAELRAAFDTAKAARGDAVTICTTTRGTPWTVDGYKTVFGRAKADAKIADRTFHDLRGTAVTRLSLAGCTVPEIATITGHDLKSVEAILDRHYLSRDHALGESAIAKLEKHRAGTATVNGAVNGPSAQAET